MRFYLPFAQPVRFWVLWPLLLAVLISFSACPADRTLKSSPTSPDEPPPDDPPVPSGWVVINPSPTNHTLLAVDFIDSQTGTAVGERGTIIHTTDGGFTWALQSSGTARHLRSVDLIDRNTAVVVGDEGEILRTTDGGLTWTPWITDITSDLYGVDFADEMTGSIVGRCNKILQSNNGGMTWESKYLPSGDFFDVEQIDSKTIIMVGGCILRSVDGGNTWRTAQSPSGATAVAFADADHGTAVGPGSYPPPPPKPILLVTEDGGLTWEQRGNSMTDLAYMHYDVAYANAQEALVGASQGGIAWTGNGGQS